jgi:hypothetical protein
LKRPKLEILSYPETLVRICRATWHLTPENPRITVRISNLAGVNRRTSDWNFCILESTAYVVWRIRLKTEGGPCYNSVISVDESQGKQCGETHYMFTTRNYEHLLPRLSARWSVTLRDHMYGSPDP